MDERILTDEKCKILSDSKYRGDFIFAFDNIDDKEIIEKKLALWRSYTHKITRLYVFCGFDRNNKWDDEFWKQDVIDVFERVKILMKYKCIPYIMRFNRYEESPYRGTYINLSRWCNQPNLFKKKTYREFCIANGANSAPVKYMEKLELECKEISDKYYDLKYDEISKGENND